MTVLNLDPDANYIHPGRAVLLRSDLEWLSIQDQTKPWEHSVLQRIRASMQARGGKSGEPRFLQKEGDQITMIREEVERRQRGER